VAQLIVPGRRLFRGCLERQIGTARCRNGAGEQEHAVPQNAPGPRQPLRDPPDPPMKDPPREPIHDPPGDPTQEPQQPYGDPDPIPGRDPEPDKPDA
jgi:hypothetical protein